MGGIAKKLKGANIYMNSPFFDVDQRLLTISQRAETAAKAAFQRIEEITEYNQQKVFLAHYLFYKKLVRPLKKKVENCSYE